MLRFTLHAHKPDPRDLLIDVSHIWAVVEATVDSEPVAMLYVGGMSFTVLDPDRDAQTRVAASKGEMIEDPQD